MQHAAERSVTAKREAEAAGDKSREDNAATIAGQDLQQIRPTLDSLYEDSPDCVKVRRRVAGRGLGRLG